MGSEKNFENKVKQFLKEQKCWFVKYWGGGQFTKAGVPDILCSCCGLFLGIEVKADNGRPSPLQIHNLKAIDETGAFAILLYPEDYIKFMILIDAINRNDVNLMHQTYDMLKGRWQG